MYNLRVLRTLALTGMRRSARSCMSPSITMQALTSTLIMVQSCFKCATAK